MLSVSGSQPIYLYTGPTDMRKSFRGLSALIYDAQGSPTDGAYYVFVNRRRTLVKVLHFEGDGLAIWYKRLARGTFLVPTAEGEKVQLDRRELMLLLEGVTPRRMKQRYQAMSG